MRSQHRAPSLLAWALAASIGLGLGLGPRGAWCRVAQIYTFGDEFVDVGTNKFVPGATYRCNVPPYGTTIGLPGNGRCSDGVVISDLIARTYRLQVASPYLAKSKSYPTGVNFASAGAGVYPSTNSVTKAIGLDQQLKQFASYMKAAKLGKFNLTDALFVVSVGTQDYARYFTTGGGNISDYSDYVSKTVNKVVDAVNNLRYAGATRFVVFGLQPLPYLPWLRYMYKSSGPVKGYDLPAQFHNARLHNRLGSVRSHLKTGGLIFFSLNKTYDTPSSGFRAFHHPYDPCCKAVTPKGTPYQMLQCGQHKSISKPNGGMMPLSARKSLDPFSNYFWWDWFVPTDTAIRRIHYKLYAGNTTFADPTNLLGLR